MDGSLATFALAAALAFCESGLGLGMIVPGETIVVILAATVDGTAAIITLAIVVTIGASLGDHVGYLLGRRFGDRIRESRAVARLGRRHFDRATHLLHTHGGRAVFLTRLLPVVRTLTPAAAGASNLEYRRFLPASLAGSALWAVAYVGGGSMAASVSSLAHEALGRATWLVAVLAAVLVLPLLLVRIVAGRPTLAAPELWRFEQQPQRELLTR